MALTRGVNHLATVTRDLDRLVRFYRDAFDAEVLGAWRSADPPWRHYAIDLGGGTFLHAFENPEAAFPEGTFRRGRIDHVAIEAPDEETLEAVRRRLVRLGASDGCVSDFGPAFQIGFRDPDGMDCEVACPKTGAPVPWDDVIDMTSHTRQDPDPVAALREAARITGRG